MGSLPIISDYEDYTHSSYISISMSWSSVICIHKFLWKLERTLQSGFIKISIHFFQHVVATHCPRSLFAFAKIYTNIYFNYLLYCKYFAWFLHTLQCVTGLITTLFLRSYLWTHLYPKPFYKAYMPNS